MKRVFVICVLLLFAVQLALGALVPTDQQKQEMMLDMINNHKSSLPEELVLSVIRQEGGEGAFYVNGWEYNRFYREEDVPWAQPTNDDGIMQVTAASGWHERSGPYIHAEDGYDHAIDDGCGYLSENYEAYGTFVQATLHYNSGPNTLWIYMNDMGDPDYISHVGEHLASFVPDIYDIENDELCDALMIGQDILNGYLSSLPEGESIDYYSPYQQQLDEELYLVGV